MCKTRCRTIKKAFHIICLSSICLVRLPNMLSILIRIPTAQDSLIRILRSKPSTFFHPTAALGPCIKYVHKIIGILDSPLVSLGLTLTTCQYSFLLLVQPPPTPLCADFIYGRSLPSPLHPFGLLLMWRSPNTEHIPEAVTIPPSSFYRAGLKSGP